MYPYMIGTPETGNYEPSFKLAREALNEKNPEDIARNAGVTYIKEANAFEFGSFSEKLRVTLPECKVTFQGTDDIPILEWRLFILHYLVTATGAPVSEALAHFRQMPGGNAYEAAFKKRSINMLTGVVCHKKADDIVRVCELLGGTITKSVADVEAVFYAAPRFPVTTQIWLADEEMEGSASVLFSAAAKSYLPTEDMAVVASLVARFMLKQFKLL